jgi:hypothetical protein
MPKGVSSPGLKFTDLQSSGRAPGAVRKPQPSCAGGLWCHRVTSTITPSHVGVAVPRCRSCFGEYVKIKM